VKALLALAAVLRLAAAEPAPDARRGLYAIWLAPGQASDYPFLVGGQAVVQWRDVEPAPGRYDFTPIERQLASGRAATVQINGNRHPEWLFERAPYTAKKLSVQVNDARGTLAYWHPAYREAYRRLLLAAGAWLKASPRRNAVLGIRLNFNAIGTEHFDVPEGDRGPGAWTSPAGVAPPLAWTRATGVEYRREVIATFAEAYLPAFRLFLRNNAVSRGEAPEDVLRMLEEGRLALFHTSSEMEPRKGNSGQYEAFQRYCRSGKTVCYAEPWADAWGRHGGKTDARWCGPEQFNYWRLLADLNCGVSFIALYGADLAHAGEPEFRAAFEFASRYAGYHASPSASPGAWVALREGNTLRGDYTFLMRRSGEMAALEKQGPGGERFGAWARRLAPGATVAFELDPAFARSLRGPATVAVTWLDAASATLTLTCGGVTRQVAGASSGRWRTAEWKTDASAGVVKVTAPQGATLHLVEVRR
jgi:hypothetical protein